MKTQQLTVRSVADSVGRALRKRAKERNVSLNRVLVEALERAAGIDGEPLRQHDLDELSGTWVSDPATDEVLAEQRRVNPRDWK